VNEHGQLENRQDLIRTDDLVNPLGLMV
jgi:hypothetical protein